MFHIQFCTIIQYIDIESYNGYNCFSSNLILQLNWFFEEKKWVNIEIY